MQFRHDPLAGFTAEEFQEWNRYTKTPAGQCALLVECLGGWDNISWIQSHSPGLFDYDNLGPCTKYTFFINDYDGTKFKAGNEHEREKKEGTDQKPKEVVFRSISMNLVFEITKKSQFGTYVDVYTQGEDELIDELDYMTKNHNTFLKYDLNKEEIENGGVFPRFNRESGQENIKD